MIYYRILEIARPLALVQFSWIHKPKYEAYKIKVGNNLHLISENSFKIWLREKTYNIEVYFVKRGWFSKYYSEKAYLKLNFKPAKPQGSSYSIKEIEMKVAKVKLSWLLSPSPDVASQELKVNILPAPVVLEPFVSEFLVDVSEKTPVHVELTASDGTNVSDPAVLDFTIGDLTKPEPPTGLYYEIVEVTG